MRFMILHEADKTTEAGVLPDEKLLTEMGPFTEANELPHWRDLTPIPQQEL